MRVSCLSASGLLILLFCWSCGAGPGAAPEAITWDLSKDFDIARVHWPKGVLGDAYERYGNFDLTLTCNDGQTIHGRCFFFAINRVNNTISSVIMHFGAPSSLWTPEEAYANAKKILTDCKFSKEDLEGIERWRAMALSPTGIHGTSEFPGYPLSLEIQTTDLHSKDGRDWSVMVVLKNDMPKN